VVVPEALGVLAAVLLVVGCTLASTLLGVETLLLAGFWLVVAGLAFGVPTGLVYHWQLWRALRARDRLPRRWWLRPTSLHGELLPGERLRVLAWCYAGAAGFVVSALGCLAVALGAFRAA
jgi:hypothetical protein